jgi:hypothetical protein
MSEATQAERENCARSRSLRTSTTNYTLCSPSEELEPRTKAHKGTKGAHLTSQITAGEPILRKTVLVLTSREYVVC